MALVLMAIHGTDGDVLPFARIGRTLAGRGHEVVLFSHAYYAEAVRQAGLGFVAVDTVGEYERYLADAAAQLQATTAESFADHFRRTGLLDQMAFVSTELVRRHRPGETVIVGQALSGHAAIMAGEATGAPTVLLANSPFQFMKLDGVAWLYGHVLADDVDACRARIGLPPVRDWPSFMRSARSYVGLWPGWFDSAGEPAPIGTRLAGFVLADEDAVGPVPARVDALLSGARPPILISGGTGRLLQPRFYRVAVEAAASLGLPALVVVRHPDLVPRPLPAGVHWEPQLPFKAVLPRVGAVVHHGGIGTVARALAAGTPQVVLADVLDRPDNGGRLVRSALARLLEHDEWSAEKLAVLIDDAVTGGRPATPEDVDGVALAADAVESALRDDAVTAGTATR